MSRRNYDSDSISKLKILNCYSLCAWNIPFRRQMKHCNKHTFNTFNQSINQLVRCIFTHSFIHSFIHRGNTHRHGIPGSFVALFCCRYSPVVTGLKPRICPRRQWTSHTSYGSLLPTVIHIHQSTNMRSTGCSETQWQESMTTLWK